MMKILIIRFSSIGDIVLTTPVIRCLKTQLKDAEIHFLTKRSFSSILEGNPYITKVHTIEKDVSEVIGELQKEKFDCVIDLHRNLRSMQVKNKVKAPAFSFRKLNVEKWLMVNLKRNKLPAIHIVDRYMETVKPLGVRNDGKGLDYFIPAKDEVSLLDLPETHRAGYIGFVIGAAHFTKRLPVEKIIAVCKLINRPIVLLGGKGEAENASKITSALGSIIYNACGNYAINQSASLVKQSQKIITHDTGLMHIAAAFQKPIVSVWGNTIPEFGMAPYYGSSGTDNPAVKSSIMEVKNLTCRPCSKIGYEKCPKGHFKCMKEIDDREIVLALERV